MRRFPFLVGETAGVEGVVVAAFAPRGGKALTLTLDDDDMFVLVKVGVLLEAGLSGGKVLVSFREKVVTSNSGAIFLRAALDIEDVVAMAADPLDDGDDEDGGGCRCCSSFSPLDVEGNESRMARKIERAVSSRHGRRGGA